MNDRPTFGRKPLFELLGADEHRGDETVAHELARALDAASTEEPDVLTHGFHVYPARMHPSIARTLLHSFSKTGDVVLDPFCGSGTVPLEGMIAGLRSYGTDLGPLAIELAYVKSRLLKHEQLVALRERAYAIGERSTERVQSRAAVAARLPKELVTRYEPHILKELAGLLEEIDAGPHDEDHRTLRIVFSSLVVKLSKRRADTSEREAEKRLRKGLPTEFFLRKVEELVERYRALFDVVPKGSKMPRYIRTDARQLKVAFGERRANIVISSPPYGGTYDYADHHVERSAWLGLDDRDLKRNEIGARRHTREEDAVPRWDDEVVGFLNGIRDVCAPGARVFLLVGDGDIRGQRIDASVHLEALAPYAHMRFVASASASRPDWLGGAPRREHIVALEPISRKEPLPAGPRPSFTPERPRNDRPRFDGPRNDRPRFDGPRNDRPRFDGPRNDRPRFDGPRNDRPRFDGPRNDRPRNDQRPDERPGQDPQRPPRREFRPKKRGF